MAKKTEILELLEKAVYWEDDFVTKYNNNSTWTLLKTLPKEKYGKIRKLLMENITDSEKHHKITRDLAEKIKRGKYDL